MHHRLRTVLAAATLAVAAVLPSSVLLASPAVAADCQHTFHARPTSTAWHTDPCANRGVTATLTAATVRVEHFWSMSGGPHITDIRATFILCRNSTSIASVQGEAAALHKYPADTNYSQNTVVGARTSGCSTVPTPSRAARGCGDNVNPSGPNAYQSVAKGRGGYFSSSGARTPVPTTGTIPSWATYYRTVIAGAAC